MMTNAEIIGWIIGISFISALTVVGLVVLSYAITRAVSIALHKTKQEFNRKILHKPNGD